MFIHLPFRSVVSVFSFCLPQFVRSRSFALTFASALSLLTFGIAQHANGQAEIAAQSEYPAINRSHNVHKMITERFKPNHPDSVSAPAVPDSELRQLIQRARVRFANMNSDFQDYRCVVTIHENIDGELLEPRRAKLLLRAEPFSVYMKYISPDEIENREVVFVEGKNKNNLISNKGGRRPNLAHLTRALKIDSELAMKESDHQITEIGMGGIMEQLLDVADVALTMPEIEIGFIQGAAIDDRSCTVIEIRHEEKTPDFPFYFARVFVDDQWEIPVRFVCYDWPTEANPTPELLEEFTYTQIEMNVGAKDSDFDYMNPNYGFQKKDLVFQD